MNDKIAVGKMDGWDHGEPMVQLYAMNHLEGANQVIPESTLADFLDLLGLAPIWGSEDDPKAVYATKRDDTART